MFLVTTELQLVQSGQNKTKNCIFLPSPLPWFLPLLFLPSCPETPLKISQLLAVPAGIEGMILNSQFPFCCWSQGFLFQYRIRQKFLRGLFHPYFLVAMLLNHLGTETCLAGEQCVFINYRHAEIGPGPRQAFYFANVPWVYSPSHWGGWRWLISSRKGWI